MDIVAFFVAEVDGFCEMRVAELFAVDHVTIIVFDNEPELLCRRVFEFDAEDDVGLVRADILNVDVLFGEAGDLFFISSAYSGVAVEECYQCDYGCADCFDGPEAE